MPCQRKRWTRNPWQRVESHGAPSAWNHMAWAVSSVYCRVDIPTTPRAWTGGCIARVRALCAHGMFAVQPTPELRNEPIHISPPVILATQFQHATLKTALLYKMTTR